MGPSFVIGAKENLGPFLLLRPKVLALNLCYVDRHVECKEIWVGPQCKALGPILTIPSNSIGRNLDDLGWHPFRPSM
jgi:bifunctional N-acetylglucosamine-1-phosphate-uridyltransferase/glucosamine-1-phosphate-acetyltransferase GlmU-like protein